LVLVFFPSLFYNTNYIQSNSVQPSEGVLSVRFFLNGVDPCRCYCYCYCSVTVVWSLCVSWRWESVSSRVFSLLQPNPQLKNNTTQRNRQNQTKLAMPKLIIIGVGVGIVSVEVGIVSVGVLCLLRCCWLLEFLSALFCLCSVQSLSYTGLSLR